VLKIEITKSLSVAILSVLLVACGDDTRTSDLNQSSVIDDAKIPDLNQGRVKDNTEPINNEAKKEDFNLYENISINAINTHPFGRSIVTRQYLPTQDFYIDDIVVSKNDYEQGIYHHFYNTKYLLKMDNSMINVNGIIYGYIQGKNSAEDEQVSTFMKDLMFIGSQGREVGMHTFMIPSNPSNMINRQELTTSITQTFNNLGVKGGSIPIRFSRTIEYLKGMSEDRKLRNVDARSYLIITETESIPMQSLPKYNIKDKIINSIKKPKNDIDIINWNIHFHHESDARGIMEKIDEVIDKNKTVIIALEETIGKYTTNELFKERGDKWFYLEMPTCQQYWSNAKAVDDDKKVKTELFELCKVLASNKPFTDIRYLVMPYTSESYKNYKSAIAGKLDGIWFIVAHLTSVKGVNDKQLLNLKNIIVKELGNPDKLVVMGDFNIPSGNETVKQFISDLGLTNSFESAGTWCGSNAKQIDYILVKGVDFDNGEILDTCNKSDHKMIKCTIRE